MTGNFQPSFPNEAFSEPGFRFHPTDEELVLYHLKNKICRRKPRFETIAELDVYKLEPEELPGHSLLKTRDRQWFFFSPRDRKYPNGSRSNRATLKGYWKATGKDRNVTYNSRTAGVKKTLVFYRGRPPKGERTDWVMHEYTLTEDELNGCQNAQDRFALYKVFKKSGPGPKNGEQYGAPFVENEFANPDVSYNAEEGNRVLAANSVSHDSCKANDQVLAQLRDLENIINEVLDDECDYLPNFDDVNAFTQSLGESAMIDSSPEEMNTLNSKTPLHELIQSTGKHSVCDVVDLRHHVVESDYLEMFDLLGPEAVNNAGVALVPSSSCEGLPVSQVEEADQSREENILFDSETFLREVEPDDHGFINTLESTQVTQALDPLVYHPDDFDGLFDGELWMNEQSNYVPSLQPSGVTANVVDPSQNQNGGEADRADQRFASSLWSFIESIPTNPAFAAESVLVNRAFERVSSFSRVRINAKVETSAAGGRNTGGRTKGFILFSLLGALLACLCALFGRYS